MIILGIDPGYGIVGFGVIEKRASGLRTVAYGVIETPKVSRFPVRLKFIGEKIRELISHYKPDAIAVEELFFQNNQKTAIMVAEARGVVLYEAECSGIPLYEYTPMQIKQAVTGYGRADKMQIQQMVKLLLGLEKIPRPDDAADALAVAVTHAQTNTSMGNFGVR